MNKLLEFIFLQSFNQLHMTFDRGDSLEAEEDKKRNKH